MADELTKIALLGTGKTPSTGATLGSHPADATVDQVVSDDREHLLLLRLGARAVCNQCGQVPRRDVPAVPIAPPERARVIDSPTLVDLVRSVVGTRNWPLLVEFLGLIATEQLVLPPQLLPEMLDLKDDEVREALRPTLGERGRWLSQFRDDWQWARGRPVTADESIGDLQRTWDEGNTDERRSALETVRRLQPELARTWLAEGIAKEKAEVRLAFLECWQTGLTADDQPFLEERLADQSEKVRTLVASLLSRLPTSELAQRMVQRADAMLRAEKGGLLRKKQSIICSPPEEIEKSWERDGIPKKPPAGMGNKAFWIERVLACVAPSHWSRRFESDPADLLTQVGSDSFAENVINGWTDAAISCSVSDLESRAWLPALATHWLASRGRGAVQGHLNPRNPSSPRLIALLKALPNTDAEAAILRLLEEGPADPQNDDATLLQNLMRPWSTDFSARCGAILERGLRKALQGKQNTQVPYWAGLITIAASGVAAPLLPTIREAIDSTNQEGEENVSWAGRLLEDARQTARRRELFYRTIRHGA
jgi:hypothetical protein